MCQTCSRRILRCLENEVQLYKKKEASKCHLYVDRGTALILFQPYLTRHS